MRIYVAAHQDTLNKLARSYKVSLENMMSANPQISHPDIPLQGSVVRIPEAENRHYRQIAAPLPVPLCPQAAPARLIDQWVPLTPLSEMEQTEYDVLVIGSGAGGSAVLWRLCEQLGKSGARIGIIDRGGLLLPTAALNAPTLSNWETMLEYYLNPKISAPVGDFLPEYPAARLVYALGGRTLFWAATTPRIPDSHFLKWPISYKEIEPYYNLAEQVLRVGTQSSPLSELLLRRLWQGGFPEAGLLPEAVSHNDYSVYFSSLVLIGEALRLGSFDLAVNARAVQILHDGQTAYGTKVMCPDGSSYVLKAKNIVVAATTFETPRLLLYSGIPGRAIGHYLINHSYMKSQAALRPEDTVQGAVSLLIPGTESRPYQLKILGGGTYLEYDVTGNIVPRYDNYLYLDPHHKDEYGIPGIQIKFSYSEADFAAMRMMTDAIRQSAGVMRANLISTAARPEICLWPPGADNHDAGTCRMGDDPHTSATNRYGQIHGVSGLYVADNSVIPFLGPANPTLTTIALAIRTADTIIGRLLPQRHLPIGSSGATRP